MTLIVRMKEPSTVAIPSKERGVRSEGVKLSLGIEQEGCFLKCVNISFSLQLFFPIFLSVLNYLYQLTIDQVIFPKVESVLPVLVTGK